VQLQLVDQALVLQVFRCPAGAVLPPEVDPIGGVSPWSWQMPQVFQFRPQILDCHRSVGLNWLTVDVIDQAEPHIPQERLVGRVVEQRITAALPPPAGVALLQKLLAEANATAPSSTRQLRDYHAKPGRFLNRVHKFDSCRGHPVAKPLQPKALRLYDQLELLLPTRIDSDWGRHKP
jgi:hypothetical protein